eukprot:GEZU01006885.1.p1 GENE.GEZU01006885.1~~GEZU01006885.1.p1  ORF type:complete len:195 (+),score=67.44 GEZU01006885.1:189-773(+)
MGLEDQLFQLKFISKQFARNAVKAEKEEKAEKLKVKKAIEKGNIDGARIYAQNAIRKKNESLNFLRLSSRIDAVASRLDTAIKMNMVSKSMGSVVKSMEKVLKTMDVDKISKIMDTFEKQFENIDVTTEYMDNSIAQTTSLSTPEDDVAQLMAQVADEHGLELSSKIGVGSGDLSAIQQDELSSRLDKLKSQKM